MSNNTNRPLNKNTIYISIITCLIVIVSIIFLVTRGDSNNSNGSNNSASTPVVNGEVNNEGEIKANVGVRDIQFGKSSNEIKEFESQMKDTLDNPSFSASSDGYTYLSYKFNPDATPSFFGTKVLASDDTSTLTYVFYKNSLIEVRIKYGKVGIESYANIVAHLEKEFGQSTSSNSYSNGAKRTCWKTKNIYLDAICQNDDVVVYCKEND